jgi:hypothetical protein
MYPRNIKEKQDYKNHYKDTLINSLKGFREINWNRFLYTPNDDENLCVFHSELKEKINNFIEEVEGVN